MRETKGRECIRRRVVGSINAVYGRGRGGGTWLCGMEDGGCMEERDGGTDESKKMRR